MSRLREFLREPEAVFWVYGFPILMTVGLGIAFQSRPIERSSVVIVDGPSAAATREALSSSETPERFKVEVLSADEARRQLRTGRTDVVVEAQGVGNRHASRITRTSSIRRDRKAFWAARRWTTSFSVRRVAKTWPT